MAYSAANLLAHTHCIGGTELRKLRTSLHFLWSGVPFNRLIPAADKEFACSGGEKVELPYPRQGGSILDGRDKPAADTDMPGNRVHGKRAQQAGRFIYLEPDATCNPLLVVFRHKEIDGRGTR